MAVDMDKIWMVKDGIIGTGHIGRDGSKRDFRPASKILPIPYRDVERSMIKVVPDAGHRQFCRCLKLPATRIEEVALAYDQDPLLVGQKKAFLRFYADFEGVTIVVDCKPYVAWYDKRLEKEFEADGEKKRSVIAAYVGMFDWSKLAVQATRSEIGRIRANLFFGIDVAQRIVYDAAKNDLGKDYERELSDFFIQHLLRHVRINFTRLILNYDDIRRAQKKEKWLADHPVR